LGIETPFPGGKQNHADDGPRSGATGLIRNAGCRE